MKKNTSTQRRKGAELTPKEWVVSGLTVIPCPFCGHSPGFHYISEAVAKPDLDKAYYSLACRTKTCTGNPMSFGDTKKAAAHEWNQRSSGGWVSPEQSMPDAEICVLIRVQSEDWPLAIGWSDGVRWFELSADPIDSTVTGWMHMEDAAGILDTTAFAKKGKGK
jgi:hypothetical protein